MFIKQIKKSNKNSDKQYIYYRLVHTYKVGNKVRHQNILGLGKLEELAREKHKALADRIEEIVTGSSSSLFPNTELVSEIEPIAQEFAEQIIKEKLFVPTPLHRKNLSKSLTAKSSSDYQKVDMDSIEQIESRDIGGEWLVKQAFDRLEIPQTLSSIGLTDHYVDVAQMLLTAKLLHPSSELEAENWLKKHSGCRELYPDAGQVSRYKLYQAATGMYNNKELVESQLYDKVSSLFTNHSKIVIYDLTNMYFQGQMLGSKKADYGRSKQKQKGSKLISLALSINNLGFVRYSCFYEGNVSESGTFEAMIKELVSQLDKDNQNPVIVMDAGIATEDNLSLLRSNPYNYDYVCVSRSLPKEYGQISEQAKVVTDNRDNKIELTKISVENKDDYFLHIKSEQKEKKEISIDQKLTQRLEAQLQDIKDKLPKKRTLKKIAKVHEKVGRIKAQLSKVGWLYDIEYTEDKDNDIVTDITWKRIKTRERPKGQYFLRYTLEAVTEEDIWHIYNLTRDVEAVFRCLKDELEIRPVHHQKDDYIEPHIWLGVIAYQTINYIRRILKENNINDSWTTIVRKMNSMQTSIVSIDNNRNEKLYAKLCTRPNIEQKQIFDALKFKHRPYVRKTKVVPQL